MLYLYQLTLKLSAFLGIEYCMQLSNQLNESVIWVWVLDLTAKLCVALVEVYCVLRVLVAWLQRGNVRARVTIRLHGRMVVSQRVWESHLQISIHWSTATSGSRTILRLSELHTWLPCPVYRHVVTDPASQARVRSQKSWDTHPLTGMNDWYRHVSHIE